jgi:hypothetical protein
VPIITVSHKDSAAEAVLETLRRELPTIVSEAVACSEEPYNGLLRPGDVNLRFLAALPLDEGLDYLVEIRTRWTQSRSEDLQERSDRVRAALERLGLERFGVWIELPHAGWSQASPRVTR